MALAHDFASLKKYSIESILLLHGNSTQVNEIGNIRQPDINKFLKNHKQLTKIVTSYINEY